MAKLKCLLLHFDHITKESLALRADQLAVADRHG
jgi:hypothetical protein